jgi:hypothetical protein
MICPGCGKEARSPHPSCLNKMSEGEFQGVIKEKFQRVARASAGAGARVREAQYGCGCEPGLLCIGHGIQAMTQPQRDAILQQPSIRTPGRRQ